MHSIPVDGHTTPPNSLDFWDPENLDHLSTLQDAPNSNVRDRQHRVREKLQDKLPTRPHQRPDILRNGIDKLLDKLQDKLLDKLLMKVVEKLQNGTLVKLLQQLQNTLQGKPILFEELRDRYCRQYPLVDRFVDRIFNSEIFNSFADPSTVQTTDSSLMAQLVFILVNTIAVFQEAEYAWADMEAWVSQQVYDLSEEEDAAMEAAYHTLDNDIDNNKSDNKIAEDEQKCTDVQQEYSNALAPWQQMQSTYSTFLQELSTSLSQITNDISSVEDILSLPATLMA